MSTTLRSSSAYLKLDTSYCNQTLCTASRSSHAGSSMTRMLTGSFAKYTKFTTFTWQIFSIIFFLTLSFYCVFFYTSSQVRCIFQYIHSWMYFFQNFFIFKKSEKKNTSTSECIGKYIAPWRCITKYVIVSMDFK